MQSKQQKDIGVLEEGGGGDEVNLDLPEGKTEDEIVEQISKEIDEPTTEGTDENVEGVDTSNLEAGFFTDPTDEDIERERALDAEEDAIQGEQTLSDEGITGDADDIEGMGGEDDESIIPASSGGGDLKCLLVVAVVVDQNQILRKKKLPNLMESLLPLKKLTQSHKSN